MVRCMSIQTSTIGYISLTQSKAITKLSFYMENTVDNCSADYYFLSSQGGNWMAVV